MLGTFCRCSLSKVCSPAIRLILEMIASLLIVVNECPTGVTHAVTWAALCSYLSLNILDDERGAMQSVLQAVHHGLGRGSGAIIGGLLAVSHGKPFRPRDVRC